MSWEDFKAKFCKRHVPTGLLGIMREKFLLLKQGSMPVMEYLDKFTTLARYAPGETDTEEKKKERFLNGLHDEMQCTLVVLAFPDLESLANAAIMLENKRKAAYENRKRKLMLQQGGPSNQRSRSAPPSRPAPPLQRTPPPAPRPNYPNRQIYPQRPGGGNNFNNNNPNRRNHPARAPGSGCYTCGQSEHFSRDCPTKRLPAPRPNATKMNQGPARGAPGGKPAQRRQGNMARGRLNHVNAEDALEAPDIVLGTFPVNSVPATVLFDSGASHSFVTEPFVKKSGMRPSVMRRPMLVQIPGSTTKTNLVCKDVPIDIQGVPFHAELIVLGAQGLEVILGMNWMVVHRGQIDCVRKAITMTNEDGIEIEYVAT